jgi:short-subunit dehydrogenase
MNAVPRKLALVTGASGGIGKAIAECFAQDKTDLIITARSEAALNQLAAEWKRQHGINVTVIAADLAQPGAADELHRKVKMQGLSVDYLVNNAGYGHFGLFHESSLEPELGMMTTNMTALTVLTKRFMPDILARKGRIMNVASTAAFQPGPYMAVYYATKAYVLSLTEAIAAELAGTGVTVTAFCPGPTRSGFQDKAAMNHSALVKDKKLPTADEVGRLGYRAMMRGRRVYIPGLVNNIMAQSVRFTPRAMITGIVKLMSRPT